VTGGGTSSLFLFFPFYFQQNVPFLFWTFSF
jgi:hypothetical protein